MKESRELQKVHGNVEWHLKTRNYPNEYKITTVISEGEVHGAMRILKLEDSEGFSAKMVTVV